VVSNRSRNEQLVVAVEVKRPALIASHELAQASPAITVAIQVGVLKFNASPVRRLGYETDLDFARMLEVALDLPARTDVPGENGPRRRPLPCGSRSGPFALSFVLLRQVFDDSLVVR